MEDLEMPPGSPVLQDGEEPSGNNDPGDTLNPDVEEDRPNAPLGDPTADVDAFEDDEAPQTVDAMEDAADDEPLNDNDEESELDDLDEEQFQDFDADALNIPDKPVAVDETNVGLLGVHKRKRTEEEERERKKKRKEGRREKPKRKKVKAGADGEGEDEEDFEGGPQIDGKRMRKSKAGAEGRPSKVARRARTPTAEDEENLSPEERRRRALDRKMDEALKAGTRANRRRGRGIDLEAAADAEIASLANRMASACQADADARGKGQVATHKLSILPEVVELMNRNTIQAQLEDPESQILTSVRFMLEPADHDAALPNYKIQRELFKILSKLHLSKEALTSSGIGKVVLFYTKSTQPQPEIKRAAEKLVGEWMRVVLKRHQKNIHNHSNVPTQSYDPLQSQVSSQYPAARNPVVVAAERRKKILEQAIPGNRARVEGGVGTYTVAPVSTLSNVGGGVGRKMGASGEDAFRKIAARGAVKSGGPGAASGRKG